MSETMEYRVFGLPIRTSELVPEGAVFVAHGEMARVVDVMTKPATPPTPDRAAVRELAEEVIAEDGDVSVHDTVTLAEYCLALLRPAPLPADVQAAVERVESAMARRRGLVAGGVKRDTKCIVASDQVAVSDVAALLAHLQRTEGK